MSAERDVNRIVRSWLGDDEHESADAILGIVLSRLDTTPQRRSWWPARRIALMNTYAKLGVAAAAVVVVAVLGYNLLPGMGGPGGRGTPPPTAVPTATTSPTSEPSPAPTAHSATPFGSGGLGMCPPPVADPTCAEDPRDDSMLFTLTVPASWEPLDNGGAWVDENAPPGGAAVTFGRGSWLYSQPCTPDDRNIASIPVGPTVDDFVTALVNHPLLDVTSPVDVTLAGYTGKYLELQVPDDISNCMRYRPLEAHIYAQGPGQRWHMWVLDVGGVRVLIETDDYAATPASRLAEEQAMIDSIVITP